MKINFDREQLELLKKLDLDFDVTADLEMDEILDIDAAVSEYLIEYGIDDDMTNEEGDICESILEMLDEEDEEE